MTGAERALWHTLRGKQLRGHRFRRQHPIGPCVVDFVCLEAKRIAKVDGGQHNAADADQARDATLKAAGYRLPRFWNNDVLSNAADVCEAILAALGPHPSPPPRAGEGVTQESAP
jgi:very-short-patch-repair endonuclease